MRAFLHVICTLVTLFSVGANSAIIDNTSFERGSFIDTETGLAWMDFGINNGKSFNYVSSRLGSSDEFFGWRLPTSTEVYALWSNLANLENVEADIENLNQYGEGQFLARDNNSRVIGGDDTVWDHAFNAIGYNTFASTDFVERTNGIGFFMGDNGLASVSFSDAKDTHGGWFTFHDELKIRDDAAYSDFFLNLAHENYSTMLVREVKVSEPATIGALIIGLILTCYRRQKFQLSY